MRSLLAGCLCGLAVLLLGPSARGQSARTGMFEEDADIGAPRRAGAARFNARDSSYTVTGGGVNMWFGRDEFHFLWRKVSGDAALSAAIRWVGTGGNPHRKACLIIRGSLDPEAPYADAALHGNGLTSLQYREARGGATHEIQSSLNAPARLRITRDGNRIFMSVASAGEPLHPAGGSFALSMADPVYVGIGVCAHDSDALETAVFSHVELIAGVSPAGGERMLESTLETIDIASTDRKAVYVTRDHIEAPNWSRDGSFFLFNSGGRLYRLPAGGGTPLMVETGPAGRCNNDHGLSPDGSLLAISDQSADGVSRIFVLPAAGGTPRRVTAQGPSYWHGWSPDGATLAFCGERGGQFDIYTIPAAGGTETRLTDAPGLDDGPDYSPDGKYIYFNSERTGSMQIWRMHTDGSAQEQITADGYNNWFAHPSPDGKWIVFLTYGPDVKGHPENKEVMLRLVSTGGGEIRVLARLFGGQGTINVPSWDPGSQHVAFVSYRLAAP
ncbi:MAG TPA: hypothetical protein VL221_03830 [Bacteroidota bacterium]|nr:hypothetical protein [Bacteroidota bacterium]